MTCTECSDRQMTRLSGVADDVMLITAHRSPDRAPEPELIARIQETSGITVSLSTLAAGGLSAAGGAAMGFAASGTGRGAATGALLGYGLESLFHGAGLFWAGRAADAPAFRTVGGLTMLGGVIAIIGGSALAYRNIKRGRR